MGAQPTEMTLQQPGLGPGQQVLFGQLAQPSSPRVNDGTYWGYTTRLAPSITQALQDCPFAVRSSLDQAFGMFQTRKCGQICICAFVFIDCDGGGTE